MLGHADLSSVFTEIYKIIILSWFVIALNLLHIRTTHCDHLSSNVHLSFDICVLLYVHFSKMPSQLAQ